MKKSTILIITAVFLISVFVVGIFGLQNVPYEEIVYVEKIVPTSVTFNAANGTVEKKVNYTKKDGGYYYVTIPYDNYKDGMGIFVNYEINPSNAVNKKMNIYIDTLGGSSQCILLDNGAFQLTGRDLVKLTYKAEDGGGATMTLVIRVGLEK